jgi:hypothetical protein
MSSSLPEKLMEGILTVGHVYDCPAFLENFFLGWFDIAGLVVPWEVHNVEFVETLEFDFRNFQLASGFEVAGVLRVGFVEYHFDDAGLANFFFTKEANVFL